MFALLSSAAFALVPFDAAAMEARLAEVAPLRAQRVSAAPALPEDAYARAARGRVASGIMEVSGHDAKRGWGVTVFDVPIAALWAGINDEMNHTGLTPVSHTEIVSGIPCADKRHVLMLLPLPLMLQDRWWIVENTLNEALAVASGGAVRELAWKDVSNPEQHSMSSASRDKVDSAQAVAFTIGAWLLIALDDGHTLGEYTVWTDPGGAIPAGPASMFAAGGIEQTFKAMRDYARDTGGGRCR